MKTTKLLWTLCMSLGIAVAVIATGMVGVFQENRDLRREVQSSRAELDRLTGDLGTVRGKKDELAAQLEQKCGELQERERDLADAQETRTRTNDTGGAVPRPAKIRTFLGNQYVGMGWLVSSGVTKDPKTGLVTYEPIVFLDDTAKQNLVNFKTNVVEREVARATTVNYNYPWLYYYPVFVPVGTNRAGHCNPPQLSPPPTSTPAPRQPQDAKPFLSTTVQPPTDRPFLPVIHQAPAFQLQNRSGGGGAVPSPAGGGVMDRKSAALAVQPRS
jgi:hypothetical protein